MNLLTALWPRIAGLGSRAFVAKYWIIAILVCSAASWGHGFWRATSGIEDKLIAGQLEAYAQGVRAQKNYDDGMRAKADAESERAEARRRQTETNAQVAEQKLDDVTAVRVEGDACVITKEAIELLNQAGRP
jgi:hypothetical protein